MDLEREQAAMKERQAMRKRTTRNGGKFTPTQKAARKKRRQRKKVAQVIAASNDIVKHGGKREGAGAPPSAFKRALMAPVTAHEILSHYDIPKLWGRLLKNEDASIARDALVYLMDREQGKAVQPSVTAQFNQQQNPYDHLTHEELKEKIREFVEENAGMVGLKVSPTKNTPPALPPAPTVEGQMAQLQAKAEEELGISKPPVKGPWSPDYNDPPNFNLSAHETPPYAQPETTPPLAQGVIMDSCGRRDRYGKEHPPYQRGSFCQLCVEFAATNDWTRHRMMPA